ncbi:hypothetical protein HN51_036025 [Arachis hypogaea]|nr:DUF617 domain-containing protein [Arachis hypogaea]
MAPPRPSKSMVISTIFDNCSSHIWFCIHDHLSTKSSSNSPSPPTSFTKCVKAFSTSHSNAISTDQTSPRVPSAPFQSEQFCLASAATTQIIKVDAATTIVGEIGQTVRVREGKQKLR